MKTNSPNPESIDWRKKGNYVTPVKNQVSSRHVEKLPPVSTSLFRKMAEGGTAPTLLQDIGGSAVVHKSQFCSSENENGDYTFCFYWTFSTSDANISFNSIVKVICLCLFLHIRVFNSINLKVR